MNLLPTAKRFAPAMGAAAIGAAAWVLVGPAAADADPDPLGEFTGGAATVHTTGKNSFSFPLATLDDAERTRFAIGNSFFKRNWVEAPASTTARDGLGPHFIARSCAGCHVMDGRGAPPDWKKTLGPEPDNTVALLFRLSVPGTPAPHDGVVPEPTYGDQFNNAGIQGVKAEGTVRIHSTPVHGRFADGTRYTLHQPVYRFTGLGYGPMAKEVMVSPRIAPHMAGLGLLEAIPETEILANARTQAAAPGPVKGQPNRVWDAFAQKEVIGRFGWKANTGSLAHQSAGAFLGDMGITSSVNWREACTPAQKDCLAAPHGGGKRTGHDGLMPSSQASAQVPEIDDKTLDDVVFYAATLAPAARRKADDPQVLRGQALFAQAQCATCHRPSYVTGEPLFPRLTSPKVAGQRIWPYTDLLLHDMGEGLADGRPDFLANGRQWKTPPLWGVGLFRDVNGHQRLLHDGRANGVLEAVLWHGGEAQRSKEQVLKFTKQDRDALVAFVNSL
ncbi:di-heme oxidoreductase family protein [Hydrogenophaga pseudoflava]|uniref:di-heme oxidoreductase family protein n=1 Tax=Hydrogenophaga pseudoflava TaxID=47421 RepID=UPI0027E4D36A|nr:di-heme oxidoredictase family protein [Hydrogenophaga pseudoflava]MDQ7746965.1 di-heme oxidoredictase family protein [Hydrogenophaga pseudoflava]